MRTKNRALFTSALPVGLVGAAYLHALMLPPLASACNLSAFGRMASYPPSAYTRYAPAQGRALSSDVEARWRLPLAVIDDQTNASRFYGPYEDTTAFVFDTKAAVPNACLDVSGNRAHYAQNVAPPHLPSLAITVDTTSIEAPATATPGAVQGDKRGTVLRDMTVTVQGDRRNRARAPSRKYSLWPTVYGPGDE